MTAYAAPFDRTLADRADVRGRTRWTMTLSVMVHAILFLLLMLPKPVIQGAEALTEITMLGPGDLEPAPAAGGAQSPRYSEQPAPGARVASTSDASFRRQDDDADITPDVPTLTAVDRMTTRLAAMRDDVSRPVASSSVGGPSALWTTPAGTSGNVGGSGQAINLNRSGTGGGGAALSLGRGGGGGSGVSTKLAGAGAAPTKIETPAGEAAGDAHARRTLAGAQLAGPIADRAVTHSVTPAYPDWAKRDGVEAAVTLYFIVRADGSVKENILVQKTAGFGDFDDSARQALAAWRFEPLRGGRTGEQWGTITFHFRLRGA